MLSKEIYHCVTYLEKKGEKVIFNASTMIMIISVEIFFSSCETYDLTVFRQNLTIVLSVYGTKV